MSFYPCSKEQQEVSENFKGGNFGLWYNKYVPLIDPRQKYEFYVCNPGDKNSKKPGQDKDSKETAMDYYLKKYGQIPNGVSPCLERRHVDQVQYCRSMEDAGFGCLTVSARLKSPLLCGVGHTHPSETSLTFEHNLGIPYIPASSVKGLVRLGYLLNFVRDNIADLVEENSINEEDKTLVPEMFGTQGKRGRIVFLDAYPVKVPDLQLDILNPHYKEYYQIDPPKAPADNQTPVPVRFLTVKPGAAFVFRAVLFREEKGGIKDNCLKAYKTILTEEGVGAKTSLGYGLFELTGEEEHPEIERAVREEEQRIEQERIEAEKMREAERLASMSPDEQQLHKIQKMENDSQQIGDICQECLDGEFGAQVYEALKKKLQELGTWNPKKMTKNKNRQNKLQKRNDKIESRIK